ncbi:MAG: SRPBCC family protein [Alphaproteobacteria bacterium]|nr:SRPBCC family protein [Alphaproteobacteria bacterium]
MGTVALEHDYPVEPRELWAIATDYGALQEVMKGIVSFDGLPEGRTETGQKLNIQVSLFGRLPSQPYAIEVIECDDEAMILRSNEKGAGVKSWQHTLTVTSIPGGSRLTDRIEIDAGFLTPFFVMWARYLYKARHEPRMRMLTGATSAVQG